MIIGSFTNMFGEIFNVEKVNTEYFLTGSETNYKTLKIVFKYFPSFILSVGEGSNQIIMHDCEYMLLLRIISEDYIKSISKSVDNKYVSFEFKE